MSTAFTCPSCDAVGHRAQPLPRPGVFTVPPGHEVIGHPGESQAMRCYAVIPPADWPVITAWTVEP